jgi:tetratricopeptide (TPR) repeat protein
MNMKISRTMKNIIYKFLLPFLFFTIVLASCEKYLSVEPKGVRLLQTVTDYDQWLNSTELETCFPNEINILADNVDKPDILDPFSGVENRIYSWQSQFSEDITTTPQIWGNYYLSIYYYNTLLKGIDDATGGTEQEKKSLKAEALLGRAFEYLCLVNLYGKVYDENTADQDLAVPFVTSNDLTTSTPDPSTVQEIYDHIITDITSAIPYLPEDNSENRYRGSVAAAYSVLARTYLYMGDYLNAAQNAQLALENGPNEVLDYSTLSGVADIPSLLKRTDAIYARLSTSFSTHETPTLSFLQSFDKTDLRLNFFYSTSGYPPGLGDYSFTTRGEIRYQPGGASGNGMAYPNWGTSVAEMRLILAETAARANELSTACDQLDLVRKFRIPAANYVKFQATGHTQEEVLQKVFQERSFEFPYCGMRWFDMRRLDAEGRMTTVNRYDGANNLINALPPGSNKYTLQIPIQVLYYNPDWPQNPTDE